MKHLTLVILISLICLWPFARQGFFETHDGEWMVIRFSAFHQALSSGQIPVRVVDRLNNNYGYPVLNFLYPLPFYLAEIPKLLGANFQNSIKLVFAVSTLSSSIFMYWALTRKFGAWAGFAGSLIYLYAPYRLLDIYVRGSLGESVAFTFLPIVLGSIFEIEKGKIFFLPVLSIAIALLILSHNVIAVLFIPIFLIMIFIILKKLKIPALIYFFLGVLSAAFFWIPAIYDLHSVRLSQISVSDPTAHLVPIVKAIFSKWGYNPDPNSEGGISVQIGIVSIFIFLYVLYLRFKRSQKNLLMDFFLAIFMLSVFLITDYSKFFWQNFPKVGIVQFPWRLLSVVVFSSSYLAAQVVDRTKNKAFLAILVAVFAFGSTVTYVKPKNFVNREDGFYSTNEDTTTVRDEYLPVWVKQKPNQRANQKIKINPQEAFIENKIIKPTVYKATIEANGETKVESETIYFPGWQAKIDGELTPLDYKNDFGLISFKLPKGRHKVIIDYGKTPVHLASEILSVGAFFVIFVFSLKTMAKAKFVK